MGKVPELLTIDLNIARDFLDSDRAHHRDAVDLLGLNGTTIELAMGPQGTLLDADGKLREEIAQLCHDENIGELRQLAYLSEATFPSDNLYPGQVVNGFQENWTMAIETWKTDKGRPPEYPDNLHVEAHMLDERDVFITRDRGLLAMCDRLREEFGHPIKAVTAATYLAESASDELNKRWMAAIPALPGSRARFGQEGMKFSVALWVTWLKIAVEQAQLAEARAPSNAMLDRFSRALHAKSAESREAAGDDGLPPPDTEDGSEATAAVLAIVGASFAIDAFYGSVKPLVAPPQMKAARPRQILECLKLGFYVGARSHDWQTELDWLFEIRDNAVHHSEAWEKMQAISETEETIVFGGRSTFNFSATSARRSSRLAQEMIVYCLENPKASTADWAKSRAERLSLIKGLEL